MDGLFTGPAGERRRFLDRLVAGFLPGHAAHVAAYEKAMRERNRLLREPGAEAAWLDALEAAMAERGVAVAVARADFTARLAAACAGRVSAFPARRTWRSPARRTARTTPSPPTARRCRPRTRSGRGSGRRAMPMPKPAGPSPGRTGPTSTCG